jgi:hypothetical protein
VLGKIKGTSINNCDFFLKFIIYVRGGQCNYLPLAPINLATALAAKQIICSYIFINSLQSRLPQSSPNSDRYF